jgi:hypothetical protein
MIICDDLHLIRQTLSDQIESDDRLEDPMRTLVFGQVYC